MVEFCNSLTLMTLSKGWLLILHSAIDVQEFFLLTETLMASAPNMSSVLRQSGMRHGLYYPVLSSLFQNGRMELARTGCLQIQSIEVQLLS